MSKIDIRQAYHQVEIHPDSRDLTTFVSHNGLWRYKRLNMGIGPSAEIFQQAIASLIADCAGTLNASTTKIMLIIYYKKNPLKK